MTTTANPVVTGYSDLAAAYDAPANLRSCWGMSTDEIVGVDKFSGYPEAVLHVTKVGDFLAPNLEAILQLSPDIAVLDDVQSGLVPKLQAQFDEAYVDIRQFTFEDWNQHRSLAVAMTQADKGYLLQESATDSLQA